MNLEELVEPITALAVEAGNAILTVYATDFDVESKVRRISVDAKQISHRITASLRASAALTPDIPIISEEDGLPDFAVRGQWQRYWLIDPLDGTKEFVNRNGEFTVNIALIDCNRPILGVVHVPVQDKTYIGCEGRGSELREAGTVTKMITLPMPAALLFVLSAAARIAAQASMLFSTSWVSMTWSPMGSSLKFCTVAEGNADIYPRLGPTSEWDTAAAQAVVEQAGGQVLELDGKPLVL